MTDDQDDEDQALVASISAEGPDAGVVPDGPLELSFVRLLAPSPGLVLVAGRPATGRSTYLATLAIEEGRCASGAYWSAEHSPAARNALLARVGADAADPRPVDVRDAMGWGLGELLASLAGLPAGAVVAVDQLELLAIDRPRHADALRTIRRLAVEAGITVALGAALTSACRSPAAWTAAVRTEWPRRALSDLRSRLPVEVVDEIHLLAGDGDRACIAFRSVGPDHTPSGASRWRP